MSLCFVYDFRVGHSHPLLFFLFCFVLVWFGFSLCTVGLHENRGDSIETHQGKQSKKFCFHQQQLPKEEWNRGNIFYTFPWYSHSFCSCRQWSLNNTYAGSASFPWVQIEVFFLKFPWGFSGLCFWACFLPMLQVFMVWFFSSSIPFIFTM